VFERPSGGGLAVLVGLDLGQHGHADSLEELRLLASSAGVRTCAVVQGRRDRPDPALFAGKGKVEEIRASMAGHGADIAIFNHALSPAQERNLERTLNCLVVDRTSLILKIFAQRAQSHEGKLQVELAQLEHLSTRLVRGWTHLERQSGGIGLRGGPGEKQLELDRRMITDRVKVLKEKLVKLRRQRDVQRKARSRRDVMSVSLVGYTNAGKSTLFNALTHAKAVAEDRLFATLDTTTRRVFVEGAGAMVISDTVGFIRELPHTLVEAFRATLEETIQADLLLHVVDAASPTRDEQVSEVNKVLAEIGAAEIPQIVVWNKIDLAAFPPGVERDEYGKIQRLRMSARDGTGLDLLRQALGEVALHSRPRNPAASFIQQELTS
jgi:GTP-binding protein HflX